MIRKLFLGMLAVMSANATEPAFSITPRDVVPGNTYVLTVRQDECKEPGMLGAASLTSPLSGIGLTPVTGDGSAVTCKASWKLEVAASTPLGSTSLVLQSVTKGEGGKLTPVKLLALPELQVNPIAAGPIPPGLTPQVDVMWKVLPWKNTADSFGRKVANQYFCIHIMVGNNTGYPIQFTSMGFLNAEMKGRGIPGLPNDPYNIARSTIEKDQLVGKRAIILNSIQALAGILSASSGFVREVDRGDFNMAVGLSNPVTAGFNMVWPDKTVRHLIGMDTRAFRDGAIVANNVPSPPIIAFISREMVECLAKDDCKEAASTRGIKRVPRKKSDFNPNQIMESLGELVLEGQPIHYLPRVNVSGNKIQLAPVPPVLNPFNQPPLNQGSKGVTLTVTGNGFQDSKIVPDPSSGIAVDGEPIIDPDGKSIRISLNASDDAPVGTSLLTVSNAAGVATLRVQVTATAPMIESIEPTTSSQNKKKALDVTVKGRRLKGATFHSVAGAVKTELPSVAGATDGTFVITLEPKLIGEAQTLQIGATRNGLSASKTLPLEITSVAPTLDETAVSGIKGTDPASVTLHGLYLKGVKVTPSDGSKLVVTDVVVDSAASPETLSFKVATKDAAMGKHKLTIAKDKLSATIDFEVKPK